MTPRQEFFELAKQHGIEVVHQMRDCSMSASLTLDAGSGRIFKIAGMAICGVDCLNATGSVDWAKSLDDLSLILNEGFSPELADEKPLG